MKKTEFKFQNFETALPSDVVTSWESSIIEIARIKGASKCEPKG